jgi:hypothetical protein
VVRRERLAAGRRVAVEVDAPRAGVVRAARLRGVAAGVAVFEPERAVVFLAAAVVREAPVVGRFAAERVDVLRAGVAAPVVLPPLALWRAAVVLRAPPRLAAPVAAFFGALLAAVVVFVVGEAARLVVRVARPVVVLEAIVRSPCRRGIGGLAAASRRPRVAVALCDACATMCRSLLQGACRACSRPAQDDVSDLRSGDSGRLHATTFIRACRENMQ